MADHRKRARNLGPGAAEDVPPDPLRRLGDVLRLSAETYERLEQQERRLEEIAALTAKHDAKREELEILTTTCAERRTELQRLHAEIQQAEHRSTRLREQLRAAAADVLRGDA